MIFTRCNSGLCTVALGAAIVVVAAATTLAANPAGAAGIVSAITTVSCSVTGANWCISGNNSSSGIGVIGTSKSGTGLRGTSTSQFGLKATSGSGTAILAQTTSGYSAISAIASSAFGTYGVNATGATGVFGEASYGFGTGVEGTTISGEGYGTYGDVSGGGTGAFGSTNTGDGVEGIAVTGTGGEFHSSSGTAIAAYANGPYALYANNTLGYGADIQGANIGIIGRAPLKGYPLVLINASGKDVLNVDGSGNLYYIGSLIHTSASARGETVRSFSPNSTQPTVEDSGTAQLARGAAVVRLDPAFAASIEPGATYRVFLTPGGDTRGLFVAAKSAAGFVVRESQGGRSTVSFDYRILATALGASGQHMDFLTPAAAAALAPRVPLPVVPARKIPAR